MNAHRHRGGSRGLALCATLLVFAAPSLGLAQDAGVEPEAPPVAPPAAQGTPVAPTPSTASPFGAAASASPSFLDATDRRVADTRPAPSADQIRALQAAEAELERFARAGTSYRDMITGIVRREYQRQRRTRDETYSQQIRVEETNQNDARERAIRVFERFIARYPNDPTYTPDAMFRLGELYYERSAIDFQQQVENANTERDRRMASGESLESIPDPVKNFNPTIDLYRTLVRQFPNYRRLDGVFYLIGYCLNEMSEEQEARFAWLNLVCANKFTYVPGAPPPSLDTAPAPVDPSLRPAQTLDGLPAAPPTAYTDPYEGCTPVSSETQFVGEVWLRLGEFHFDSDASAHGLDRAISAYAKVLATPEDRNYSLALYKTAWSHYRASRFVEAIRHFGQLVQWSDDEQQRTGRAGSELRSEAVQYIAITFAYTDWNENLVPDDQEGLPTGFQRVQDAQLIPQDRPWTEEVYFQLGNAYFDEAKYPQAIEVWNYALNKWTLSPRAPEITNMIARAYRRNNELEREIETRSLLANYGVGTTWYNANIDHPAEQRRAEELAERALIDAALNHHERAQSLRAQGVVQRDEARIRLAREEYRLAADAYRAYIQRYPNDPQAYEVTYSLADALYWSENFEEAAREYANVRDSNLDGSHLSESARRVVESLKRLVDQAVANQQIEVRTDPPAPSGTPASVTSIPMPDLVQRLAQAREVYLARVDVAHDSEHVRDSYDYNNALLLYVYGFWPQAKERFTRIFAERCTGPNADETGDTAYKNLRNMAVALGQPEEVARLASVLRRRQCTFRADVTGAPAQPIDCSLPENAELSICIAGEDLNNEQYRVAVELFSRAEGLQASQPEESRRLFEQSATRLITAVNASPNDSQAPVALEKAALALQNTQRFDAASRIYQRIIDEVGPRRGENETAQQSLDNILSNAYFQLAFSANSNFDYDRAIQNYRILVDTPRFANSTAERIVQRREDALVNVANILEYQQRYADAAQYYRRVAQASRDAATVLSSSYRVAEMAFKRRNWADTIREMETFIARYRTDNTAGELVIQAYWRIVEARKASNQTTRIRQSLQDVVDAFGRMGLQPGSLAAEYAAQAKFELVDGGSAAFESFAVNPGRPRTLAEYVQSITTQIADGSTRSTQLTEGYNPVPSYRRPTWTIAAFVRQGRIYEVLARAILNTPFTMPADMQQQSARLDADNREAIRVQVQDRIQQVLDEKTRPVECLAVVRYALAARAARIGNIDNEYTRIAIDRLSAYGEERVNECVTQQSASDTTFAPPQEHEFARANRGLNLEIRTDIAPPPPAPEDQ